MNFHAKCLALLFTLGLVYANHAQGAWTQADLKVVAFKTIGGTSYSVEQFNSLDAVPAAPLSREVKGWASGNAASLRAVTSDGDTWYTISRSGGSNCFERHSSYLNMVEGISLQRNCNAVAGDGYRGIASDGRYFYSVFWDGTRHWWQSYRTWSDVVANRPYSRQSDKRNADIYKGIAFDPAKRIFISLAQGGATVWLYRYANFNDMATVTTLPGSTSFTSNEQWTSITVGPVDPVLDVYLVAGQSNAVGWKSDGTHFDGLASDKEIQFFYRIGNGMDESHTSSENVTTLQVQRAAFGNTPAAVFGIEMGAARKLYDHKRRRMAVVKVAFGGTDLFNQWSPLNTSGLYKLMQDQLSRASSQWRPTGKRTRLVGFFWMQGEWDALDANKAGAYATSLKTLLSSVRTAAGDDCLPVVVGRLRLDLNLKYAAEVRRAQEDVVARDTCATLVNTDDLPLDGDLLHFSTAGSLALGDRMGEAYRRLAGW